MTVGDFPWCFRLAFPDVEGQDDARRSGLRVYSADLLVAASLAVTAGVLSFWGSGLINPVVYDLRCINVWFQGDFPRVYTCMVNRWSELHYRSNVHPLFGLLSYIPVFVLTRMLNVPPITAVRLVVAGGAAALVLSMFVLLRLISLRRLDSIIFCTFASASASAMFWCVGPESYSFGLLSILLALIYVVASERGKGSPAWAVLVSAATLSITITNWLVGLLATFLTLPLKKALKVSVYAFAIVSFVFGVQKYLMPMSVYFLGSRDEQNWMFRPEAGGAGCVARAFVFHSVIMPRIREVDEQRPPSIRKMDPKVLSVQHSSIGSAGPWGLAASVLWGILLGLGALSMLLTKRYLRFRVTLGVAIVAQFLLHCIYGEETFLYSLHFGPLLIIVAAFAVTTRARPIVLVLAAALCVFTAVNNLGQLEYANSLLANHRPQPLNVQNVQVSPQDASGQQEQQSLRMENPDGDTNKGTPKPTDSDPWGNPGPRLIQARAAR